MPEVYVDISVYEFYENCSKSDRETLRQLMGADTAHDSAFQILHERIYSYVDYLGFHLRMDKASEESQEIIKQILQNINRIALEVEYNE